MWRKHLRKDMLERSLGPRLAAPIWMELTKKWPPARGLRVEGAGADEPKLGAADFYPKPPKWESDSESESHRPSDGGTRLTVPSCSLRRPTSLQDANLGTGPII